MALQVHLVRVFADGQRGGNPAPIVIDAAGLSDEAMRAIAQAHGHESGFVLAAPPDSDSDYAFRFFVPNHEMEMCGHATVGAVWVLAREGRLRTDHLSITTLSGRVEARVACNQYPHDVEVSQPTGAVRRLALDDAAAVLSVLGLASEDLASPIQNARTSRVKTLVPLWDVSVLDALRPDFGRMEAVCDRIGSTGLYPYAASATRVFDARQFPKSSGYPEDAATGIAATALAFGLLTAGIIAPTPEPITIRQGRAMGRPSRITVRFQMVDGDVEGCWLGGAVEPMTAVKA